MTTSPCARAEHNEPTVTVTAVGFVAVGNLRLAANSLTGGHKPDLSDLKRLSSAQRPKPIGSKSALVWGIG